MSKTIDQVDGEISKIREAVLKLEMDKDTHTIALAAARNERETFALAALSGDDPDAQQRLVNARSLCRESEMLVEDIASAISAAHQRLQALEAEREEAIRADAWEKFLKTGETAVSEAKAIEKAASQLATVMAQHEKTLRLLSGWSAKAGRGKLFRLSHCRRAIEHYFNRKMPKEFVAHREFSDGYYKFLKSRIKNMDNGNEAEPEQEQEIA